MPIPLGTKRAGAAGLFLGADKLRHPKLFLPRMLAEEAGRPALDGLDLERARAILEDWCKLADGGHLNHKETRLDADFLEKIFGDALGYRSISESPLEYQRERNFSVPAIGTADGALGNFVSAAPLVPVAVIELKGAQTDLDHDKFAGRTPVQQLWDYLNQLPDTPWGILSNYVTIRLYHRDSPARAYEEFTIQDFRDPQRFRQFYYLFQRYGLLGNKVQRIPRALELLRNTQTRQREVGDELYEEYSKQRLHLIEHLIADQGKSQDQAIHIAQKVLDRIIFVAFCEDRALLPEKIIHRAYSQLPAFTKVTNPRWQSFKTLFGMIDEGNDDQSIPAFDGGLFKKDPPVDDLELSDDWTHFFDHVGTYDFRDEINVDVLGHLFERSVTELEKLRVVGFFGKQSTGASAIAAMPKSAQRKRFGIYYTPPQFTQLIVDRTLGELIHERVEPLEDLSARVAALRKLKVCDPACGSGAFLIAAYERLEQTYEEIVRLMRIADDYPQADKLQRDYPDYILSDNLYGVDLSAESVEITQLALWIRSARKGRTLADLSANIICGNSLIRDPAVHPKAIVWGNKFPTIFVAGGFDVVIGNPPWERMKLQEREFFSLAAPDIAASVNAADRRKLIAAIESKHPELWQRYQDAQSAAERISVAVRSCGDYPLTARGDVNTYMLFAELARSILAPEGRAGLLVPSGIATDDTTRHFFNDLMDEKRLIALYDFENRKLVFPDVDGRFKFSVLLMGGQSVQTQAADFVFFAHKIEDLEETDRHIALTAKDLKLLNLNTKTCPIFKTRRDAELTRKVYRNVPILIDENRKSGGNPWGIKFGTMFHQTNDAELFIAAEKLKADGFKLEGNRWVKRKQVYLPLYEAKMIQAFDHRAAGVVIADANWMRQGQPEETSVVSHQNPEFTVIPRYWVPESHVEAALAKKGGRTPAFIGFKDITSATNQRTMIAAAIPWSAVTNHFPLLLSSLPWPRAVCLLGNLNSLAFDYIARQKLGAVTLNFFIVEQLPTLPPDRYDDNCPWDRKQTLEKWVSDRVLKLTCTANDMLPLAEAAGFTQRIHKWKPEERHQLRAELDAAYFHLYGYSREDVEYVLGTFQAIAKEDEADGGGETRRLILGAYDAMA